jgi:hypothetical protein
MDPPERHLRTNKSPAHDRNMWSGVLAVSLLLIVVAMSAVWIIPSLTD